MHDDLRAVAIEQRADGVRRVEVERGAVPRDRTRRASERRVGKGGHERTAEATGRPGDRDTHQSVGVVAGSTLIAAAWPVASR